MTRRSESIFILANCKEVFYFNPKDFNCREKRLFRCMSMGASNCEESEYLKDFGVNHGELQECDKEIDKMLATWAGGVYKAIEIKILTQELDRKVSGLWWCAIF
jgi:hypothetical protein